MINDKKTILEILRQNNINPKLTNTNNNILGNYQDSISIFNDISLADFLERSEEYKNSDEFVSSNNHNEQEANAANLWQVIYAFGAEEIFKKLDINGDGILSNDELSKFNNVDRNTESFSLTDLKDILLSFDGNDIKTPDTEQIHTKKANIKHRRSSTQGSNNTYKPAQKAKTVQDYDNAISQKESEIQNIKSNTENLIADEEQKISDLMNDPNSGLTAQMYEEYDKENKRLDGEIKEINTNIETQKNIISDSEAVITAKTTAIASYNNQISTLESKLSALTGDENASKRAELQNKINNLKDAKTNAENAKKEAENNKRTAEAELQKLEADKTQKETEKAGLKDKLINDNLGKLSPDAVQIISDAKAQIEKLKNEEQTKINELNNEISKLKTERAELAESEETKKVIAANSTLPATNEELAKYGFDTAEKRDAWNHLKPEMQEAIVKLTDYAESQGIKITYNSKISIFRTYEDQVKIYKNSRSGFAAKPGNSRHESGEAVDITIPGANKNNPNDPQYKKLAQFWMDMGYTWGGKWKSCEPWHFDLRAKK